LHVPENAVVAFTLGADLVNVGREAMLSMPLRRSRRPARDSERARTLNSPCSKAELAELER
jgi:hypothetical protein